MKRALIRAGGEGRALPARGAAAPSGAGISAQAPLIVPEGENQGLPEQRFNLKCVSH